MSISGEDTAGAVSVFLYPANTNAINRQFSFAIGFVNEECSRVMKGKGDHCFRDNQNGWGWLKLVTHQTLRYDIQLFQLTQLFLQICK